MKSSSLVALLGFGACTAAVAAIGSVPTRRAVQSAWYERLRKPRAQPPAAVFGPVWTTLYALMSVAAWRTWRAPPSRTRSRALALWGAQLALNGAWSPLFFGARRPAAALGDLALLVPTIAACTHQMANADRPAAAMMLPYVGWTLFATGLNAAIVAKNPSA